MLITSKYKLKKPEYSDKADVEILNENMDIIENVLSQKVDGAYVEQKINALNISTLASKEELQGLNNKMIDSNNNIVGLQEDVKRINNSVALKANLIDIQNLAQKVNNINLQPLTEQIKLKADRSEIKTKLSELQEDANHTTVSKEEKRKILAIDDLNQNALVLNGSRGLLANISILDADTQNAFFEKGKVWIVDKKSAPKSIPSPKEASYFIAGLGAYTVLNEADVSPQSSGSNIISMVKRNINDMRDAHLSAKINKTLDELDLDTLGSDAQSKYIETSSIMPTLTTLNLYYSALKDKIENNYIPQRVLSESEYNSLTPDEKNRNVLYFIRK